MPDKDIERLLSRCRPLGPAGFLIENGLTIYIDPVEAAAELPKADVVFLTGSGERHYSPKDVEAVSTAATVVAGAKDCVARFRLNQLPLREGDVKNVLGLPVKVLAAGEAGGLGYVLDFGGASVLAVGAGEPPAAMAALKPDVVLRPGREPEAAR